MINTSQKIGMTTLKSINEELKDYGFDLKLVQLKLTKSNSKMKVFCLEGDAAQYDETGDDAVFEVKSINDLNVNNILDKAENLTQYHERYLTLTENASLEAQVVFTNNLEEKYKTKHTNRLEQLDYLEEVVIGTKIIESLDKLKKLEKIVAKQKKKMKKMSKKLKEKQ